MLLQKGKLFFLNSLNILVSINCAVITKYMIVKSDQSILAHRLFNVFFIIDKIIINHQYNIIGIWLEIKFTHIFQVPFWNNCSYLGLVQKKRCWSFLNLSVFKYLLKGIKFTITLLEVVVQI